MKLDYKKTILVGLAFFSICAFWQLYNAVIPLMLKNSFQMPETQQGVVMALDNIFAVFLLPFFGTMSDKCKLKLGRRMPFIVIGTAIATVLMIFMPIADHTRNTTAFIAILFLILLAMGLYRSPAVSLMSDVTQKPLRSKANGIINLMGALGGVYTLVLLNVLVSKYDDGRDNYELMFVAVAVLMIISIVIMLLTINERKQSITFNEREEAAAEIASLKTPKDKAEVTGFKALPKDQQKSLLLILFSIFFWFIGYNAVETNFTKFAQVQWGGGIGYASQCLLIATLGAVVSYIPVGIIATKFGRKRTIQVGIVMLATCFFVASLFKAFTPIYYVLFVVIGMSWAAINVNSLPMVVEICSSKDIGKFTGYYYTFSMAAQIITPIFCGFLLQTIGYSILMPYGAIAVAISFITISMTKYGDSIQVSE